ncbi:MAG: hypothetical protein PHR89_04640 [Bacilli bacterium]|nr:hypothetical protein [Bacilli bacterium]
MLVLKSRFAKNALYNIHRKLKCFEFKILKMKDMRMHFCALMETDRKLISLMGVVLYGRLENLAIEDGHAKITAASRKISTANFEREESPHTASRPDGDFILTDRHVRFLRHLRKVGNGRINSITIRAGLPVSAEIEETVASI